MGKPSALFIALLLGAALFSILSAPIPKANACGNNIACTNAYTAEFGYANNGGCAGCTGKTTTSIASLYTGDLLLVTSVGSDKTQSVTGITDTQGNTFKDGATYTGGNYIEEIWYAVMGAGCTLCSDTITSTLTGSQANYYMIVAMFRTAANITRLSMHATTTGGTPLSLPSFNANDHSLTYGVFVTDSSVHGATIFQSPFTNGQCNNVGMSVFNCQGLGQIDDGYFYTSAGMNGVIMATGAGGSNANVDGLEVNFDSTLVVVSTVVPCTFFQLQCWLYPMFFFSVYMILTVGLAVAGESPARDIQGLVLEALSLSSLLAVVIGMINIMVPLVITVYAVLRAIRA